MSPVSTSLDICIKLFTLLLLARSTSLQRWPLISAHVGEVGHTTTQARGINMPAPAATLLGELSV
jgi:hypothetical protein